MCRTALKRTKGCRRVFNAEICSLPHEGRILFKNIVVFDEAGKNIVGYVGHLFVKKKPFKYKKYKKGDLVRFTGESFLYERANGSTDFSLFPGQKNRKLSEEERENYQNYLKARKASFYFYKADILSIK